MWDRRDRRSPLGRRFWTGSSGVTTPWADLCGWIADEADFAAYDGTMDWGGRGAGQFDLILGRRTKADEEAGWEAADAWLLPRMPIEATA